MREKDILRYLNNLIEVLDANNKAKQIVVIRAETIETLLLNIIGAVNIINRQQAEIEDLRKVVIDDYATEYDNKIIAEAIKEFAEKLKEKAEILLVGQNGNYYSISDKDIDNLVKKWWVIRNENNGKN